MPYKGLNHCIDSRKKNVHYRQILADLKTVDWSFKVTYSPKKSHVKPH